jgi:hypothetical protein
MAKLPPIAPAPDHVVLKPREAAYLARCSLSALYKRVQDGVIPHRYEGHRLIFLRQELEVYLTTLPGISVEAAQAQRQRLEKLRDNGVSRSGETRETSGIKGTKKNSRETNVSTDEP